MILFFFCFFRLQMDDYEGQMDQQLPERSAAAGAAVAPANGAPAAATAGNIDTKQIVDAVKEAVKDASAIAMKALTEEVKKTNDPVSQLNRKENFVE
eukprot:UN21757